MPRLLNTADSERKSTYWLINMIASTTDVFLGSLLFKQFLKTYFVFFVPDILKHQEDQTHPYLLIYLTLKLQLFLKYKSHSRMSLVPRTCCRAIPQHNAAGLFHNVKHSQEDELLWMNKAFVRMGDTNCLYWQGNPGTGILPLAAEV